MIIAALALFLLSACGSTKSLEPSTTPVVEEEDSGAGSQEPQVTELGQATEPPVTLAEESPPWPSARIHPSMFYDPTRERLLLFSGMTRMERTVDLNQVWAYDAESASWEYLGEMTPKDSMINFGFDEESGRVVVLNLSPLETWSYDLESGEWELQEPSEQPPYNRRFGAPMAYDAESDRLILFGGGAPGNLRADTWAYDYNTDTWENMEPSNHPSPRSMYQVEYDAESDRVILWGGFMEPGIDDVLIWTYDYNTNTWESFENTGGPQRHWERGGMVYLPGLDRMLLFTGMLEYEDVLVGPETWYYEYNTNTWTKIETEMMPPQMTMYAMEYDPSTGNVILFGGELTSKYAGNTTNEIWIFDPEVENWSRLTPPALDGE
jgi:hypothetical protein